MLQIRLQEASRRQSSFMISQDGTDTPERLSEYFGAMHIDHLDEHDTPNPKLTKLFDECFRKKIFKKPQSPIRVMPEISKQEKKPIFIPNPMPSPA